MCQWRARLGSKLPGPERGSGSPPQIPTVTVVNRAVNVVTATTGQPPLMASGLGCERPPLAAPADPAGRLPLVSWATRRSVSRPGASGGWRQLSRAGPLAPGLLPRSFGSRGWCAGEPSMSTITRPPTISRSRSEGVRRAIAPTTQHDQGLRRDDTVAACAQPVHHALQVLDATDGVTTR
jgi:hypothetical protein